MDKSEQSPLRGLKPGEPTDNTSHTVIRDIKQSWDPFRPRATELAAGVTLFTKDSSTVGNGIIVKQLQPGKFQQLGGMTDYLERTGQKLWLVETDFGNNMKLVDAEIREYYELGYQYEYNQWWSDRADAMLATHQMLEEPIDGD
jgi:hypothetical protein